MYHRRIGPQPPSRPLPLPQPQPIAPVAERRERSWIVSAGSRQFSFTRIEYRAASPGCERSLPRAAGWRPTTVAGAILAMAGSATLIGLAVTATGASAGYRYVVSVPVPPLRPAHRTAVAGTEPPVVATRPRAPTAAPSPRIVVPVPATADYVVGEQEPADAPAAAMTAKAAIGAALATGRLQQWTSADGGERGFVVVGPAESGAGRCRSLSILTRRDGVNAVERRRECAGPPQPDAPAAS